MTDLQRKNIVYSLLLIVAMLVVWWVRDSESSIDQYQKVTLTGATMGTTYQVKYLVKDHVDHKSAIDSLLEDFNNCLSTYIAEAEISRFNRGSLHKFERPYFHEMLIQSKDIHEKTGGAFDPTVMPLVSAWGFGPDSSEVPEDQEVALLLESVGFDKIFFDEYAVCKLHPSTQLDFSAIAKGYAVDLVLEYLEGQGLEHIFVEIGGEISARGVNEKGKPWAIFIEKPEDHDRAVQAMVTLDNIAIATSGNYRNFYIKDGIKYAHTISPYNGNPVQHSLLSVSVFSGSCAAADAYATAFMVLGLEKAKQVISEEKGLEAYFIYSGSEGELLTYATTGIKDIIIE